ncbi:hypothetical protein ACXR2T_07350 [Leucobacter sp. HY1910]
MPQASCSECVTERVLPAHAVATLRSRDYDLRPVSDVQYAEVGAHKPLEPSGWFQRVIASVLADGILEPILATHGPQGLELIDGNHRAWAAAHHGLDAPVRIFTPACGDCTEESFAVAAMAGTAERGWKY